MFSFSKKYQTVFQRGCNNLSSYCILGNSFGYINSPTFAHLMGMNGQFHSVWVARSSPVGWSVEGAPMKLLIHKTPLCSSITTNLFPSLNIFQGSILGGLVVKGVWMISTLIIYFCLAWKKISSTTVAGTYSKVVQALTQSRVREAAAGQKANAFGPKTKDGAHH